MRSSLTHVFFLFFISVAEKLIQNSACDIILVKVNHAQGEKEND